MAENDPVRTFVDSLSAEQRAVFLLLNRTKTADLQAAVTASTSALSKVYGEFNWSTNLVQMLECTPAVHLKAAGTD